VDSYGDTILPGAFKKTLSQQAPKMFFDHQWSLPIGKWTNISEDSKGLFVEGELTTGLALAADVGAALRHGTIDGLSIGGYLKSDGYTEKDGARAIHEWTKLMEISVVAFPADDAARVADAKSDLLTLIDEVETIRDFERLLRDAVGVSKSAAVRIVAKARALVERREADRDAVAEVQNRLSNILERLK
jgi:HK97 family phage prohead protease